LASHDGRNDQIREPAEKETKETASFDRPGEVAETPAKAPRIGESAGAEMKDTRHELEQMAGLRDVLIWWWSLFIGLWLLIRIVKLFWQKSRNRKPAGLRSQPRKTWHSCRWLDFNDRLPVRMAVTLLHRTEIQPFRVVVLDEVEIPERIEYRLQTGHGIIGIEVAAMPNGHQHTHARPLGLPLQLLAHCR
jgi:hypothetical protein